jgi:hypothetical protein
MRLFSKDPMLRGFDDSTSYRVIDKEERCVRTAKFIAAA